MKTEDTYKTNDFDSMFSPHTAQIIKAAIPYIRLSEQKFLSVYVRFLELNHTIEFFKNKEPDLIACSFEAKPGGILNMLTDIRPLCNDSERESVDTILNCINAFQMYQKFNDVSKKAASSDASEANMDILKSFLSPEQQSMFETYSMLFNSSET